MFNLTRVLLDVAEASPKGQEEKTPGEQKDKKDVPATGDSGMLTMALWLTVLGFTSYVLLKRVSVSRKEQ